MRAMFDAVKAKPARSSSRRLRTALGAITLIVLTATAIGGISASADRTPRAASSTELVGSWMVTVNRGPTIPAFQSLRTYTKGHGVVETANTGATNRSPSHGAWKRVGHREYGTTLVFFRYDPTTAAYLGTVKLREVLELAPDGQSFTGVSVPEFRDPDGHLLPGSNARRNAVAGKRINVEPLP